MSRTIVDSGPLVAWFCPRDVHHAWVVEVFQTLGRGCLTCESVFFEVCHLAAKEGVPPDRVLGEVERGGMVIMPLTGEIAALRLLLQQYRDINIDFADACVVRLAEFHRESQVCTTDTDFRVYRRQGREVIPLLAPFG